MKIQLSRLAMTAACLGMATMAAADDGTAQRSTQPLQGKVMQLSLPRDLHITNFSEQSCTFSEPGKNWGQPGLMVVLSSCIPPASHFKETAGGLEHSSPAEWLLETHKNYIYNNGEKLISSTPVQIDGQPGLAMAYGPAQIKTADGKLIDNQDPSHLRLTVLADGRYLLEIGLIANGPTPGDKVAVYRDHHQQIQAIQQSIRIVDEKTLTAEQRRLLPRRYASPMVMISQRRDYHLNMGIEAVLPGSWTIKELASKQASETSEIGAFAIEILSDTATPDNGVTPSLLVIGEGLPVGPLSMNDYLASIDKHLKELGKDLALESTSQQVHFGTMMLTRTRNRYSSGTRDIILRTYRGLDPQGRKITIRAYTAGGMTGAFHLLFISGEQGDDSMESILPVLNCLITSPSIQLPGR